MSSSKFLQGPRFTWIVLDESTEEVGQKPRNLSANFSHSVSEALTNSSLQQPFSSSGAREKPETTLIPKKLDWYRSKRHTSVACRTAYLFEVFEEPPMSCWEWICCPETLLHSFTETVSVYSSSLKRLLAHWSARPNPIALNSKCPMGVPVLIAVLAISDSRMRTWWSPEARSNLVKNLLPWTVSKRFSGFCKHALLLMVMWNERKKIIAALDEVAARCAVRKKGTGTVLGWHRSLCACQTNKNHFSRKLKN